MKRNASIIVLLALGMSQLACSDNATGFEDVLKRVELIADIEDRELPGQNHFAWTATVVGDMSHPHFEADWSNLNSEVDVDLYVLRAEDFDPSQVPPAFEDVFWTSAPDPGESIFGNRRTSEITLHPSVGSWVLVLFNQGAVGAMNTAELSAEIRLTYYR